jgi:hypothetical protein
MLFIYGKYNAFHRRGQWERLGNKIESDLVGMNVCMKWINDNKENMLKDV